MPYPAFEGFLTALVSIAYAMQAAKVLARKCSYKVSTKQELRALGAANIFGSFFSCFVAAPAVGRNLILEQMGSRSQLSALFGCLLTGLLLAFASQSLYYLPFSVIATIITLTLAMTLKMFGDLPRLYRSSKLDATEWMLTFVGCCLLDIEWGLLLGLLFSWVAIIFRAQRPRLTVLGKSGNFDGLYVAVKHDKSASELPGIKILRIENNSIHYANAEFLLQKIVSSATSENGAGQITRTNGPDKGGKKARPLATVGGPLHELSNAAPVPGKSDASDLRHLPRTEAIILDFSLVSSVDSTGLRALDQLAVDLAKNNVHLFVAHCRERHLKRFEKYGIMKSTPRQNFVGYVQEGVIKARQAPSTPVSDPKEESTLTQADESAAFWNVAGMPVEGLEYGEALGDRAVTVDNSSPGELEHSFSSAARLDTF